MREEVYDISGMHCAACSASVEKVTRRLPGVERSDVNLVAERMTIVYDETQVTPEQIIAKVEKAGFGAKLHQEKQKAAPVQTGEDPEELELRRKERELIVSAIFSCALLYVSMGQMLPFGLPSLPLPDLLSIRLTQGRLPEKAGELLLPEHLWSNGSVRHMLGDTMELELGHRTLDGEKLTADDPYTKGETLTDTTPHTYTVVGFYQRLDMTTEPFSCPGYTALTCQEQGYQTDEFFRVAHPSRFYSYMEGNAEKYPGLAWYSNSDLLNYYGATTFFSVNRMIYSFAVILLLMISFGSVSLIYNSFSISVAERTRQFGILNPSVPPASRFGTVSSMRHWCCAPWGSHWVCWWAVWASASLCTVCGTASDS